MVCFLTAIFLAFMGYGSFVNDSEWWRLYAVSANIMFAMAFLEERLKRIEKLMEGNKDGKEVQKAQTK